MRTQIACALRASTGAALLLGTFACTGCGGPEANAPSTATQLTAEQRNSTDPQVKAIMENPKIPEDQKARAIEAMQAARSQQATTGGTANR